ncbi:hypothetical protein PILCRDRAFT_817833, partial [Piloderma croceum F 1598]
MAPKTGFADAKDLVRTMTDRQTRSPEFAIVHRKVEVVLGRLGPVGTNLKSLL